MEVFLQLVPKIIPLYIMIGIGYIAAKYTKIHKETLAILSIYFFVPVVMFYGVMNAGFSLGVMLVPVVVWGISSAACLIVYFSAKRFLQEKTQANILSLAAGTANSGYFGIPIAMMIFDERGVGIYITTVLGMTIFQNTLGYYMTSIGNYSAKESLRKLVRLPVIYAFILGILLNSVGIHLPEASRDFFLNIRGAYIVVGMMIIGAGIAAIDRFKLNLQFTLFALAARHLVWPICAFMVYYLDQATFGIFDENIRKALVLASIVPLAADTVAFASLLKSHPEETATTVLLSSIIAVIYIPIMVGIFL